MTNIDAILRFMILRIYHTQITHELLLKLIKIGIAQPRKLVPRIGFQSSFLRYLRGAKLVDIRQSFHGFPMAVHLWYITRIYSKSISWRNISFNQRLNRSNANYIRMASEKLVQGLQIPEHTAKNYLLAVDSTYALKCNDGKRVNIHLQVIFLQTFIPCLRFSLTLATLRGAMKMQLSVLVSQKQYIIWYTIWTNSLRFLYRLVDRKYIETSLKFVMIKLPSKLMHKSYLIFTY